MVLPFERVAFSTKPGRVSKPVRTKFGWHLVKVRGRTAASSRSFASVKDEIEQRLRAVRMSQAKRDLLHRVRGEATIELLGEFAVQ
jgi:parvulin-like peptidyl-prolyl isomerase